MINVVYSGDHFIFKGIYLSALSIVRRSKQDFHFHIMSVSLDENDPHKKIISKDDISQFEKMIKNFNKNNKVSFYDVTDLFRKNIMEGKNAKNYFTPYCMVRLLVSAVLPQEISKIIYLDADTLALKDIKELWDIDVTEYEIAVAPDYLGRFWMNLCLCPHYFNSGVMLINLDKTRQTKFFDKCIDYLFKKKLLMADQSAMYKIVKLRKKLPMRFNDQRAKHKDTVIAHFPKRVFWWWKPVKPWDNEKMHSKLKLYDWDEDYAYLMTFYI